MMASLFTHSRLKLWVWIVIMIAGSIILLSLLSAVWWYAKRIRVRQKSLPTPVLAPTRKVSVSRGRMVPTSRYLSLTGSTFGLGQFLIMEEKDQGETGRSRSKSPFKWWPSNIQDHSQSRQSQISSQPQLVELQSRYYRKPKPAFFNHHAHEESAASDYSSASIINGKELAEDARVRPSSASVSSGSPHSSRYVNFSRAFSPLHRSALTSNSAPQVLSHIKKSSLRHSTASKHLSAISAGEIRVGDISSSVTQPEPALRLLQASVSVPDHLSRRSSGQHTTSRFSYTTETSISPSAVDLSRTQLVSNTSRLPRGSSGQYMTSRFSFATETSISPSAVDLRRTQFVSNISHLPASPQPQPLRRGKAYLDDDTPEESGPLSVSEDQPTETLHDLGSQPSGPRADASSKSPSMAYWKSRSDMQP